MRLRIQNEKIKTNNIIKSSIAILIFATISCTTLIAISNLEIGKNEQNKVLEAFDTRITGYEVFPRITINNKLYLTTLDYWSECVTIGQAFSKGSTPFVNRPAGELSLQNICDDVKSSMKSDLTSDSQKYYSYPQYIHGDAAVVKIILKLTSIKNGKILLSLLLITLMLFIVYEMLKSDRLIGVVYFIYFFLLTDLVFQGFSLAHGIASLWALSIIIVIYKYILKGGKLIYAFSMIGGSGYAILSMMHNPIQYLGLVIMISFIGFSRYGLDLKEASTKSFNIAFFWGLGGVFTMIFHWLIVGIFSDGDSLGKALNSGLTERFSVNPYDSVYIFFGLLKVQIFQFSLSMFGLLLMMFIFGYVSKGILKNKEYKYKVYLYLLSPTILVGLWFLTMTGHIGHGWTINLLFTSLLNIVSVMYFLKQRSIEKLIL
jgi:hypothetical protein